MGLSQSKCLLNILLIVSLSAFGNEKMGTSGHWLFYIHSFIFEVFIQLCHSFHLIFVIPTLLKGDVTLFIVLYIIQVPETPTLLRAGWEFWLTSAAYVSICPCHLITSNVCSAYVTFWISGKYINFDPEETDSNI